MELIKTRMLANMVLSGGGTRRTRGKPHYANMSVQYTAIFHGCKNGNFQMKKKCDMFLIFAQNIDCGCTLDEYTQSMF